MHMHSICVQALTAHNAEGSKRKKTLKIEMQVQGSIQREREKEWETEAEKKRKLNAEKHEKMHQNPDFRTQTSCFLPLG